MGRLFDLVVRQGILVSATSLTVGLLIYDFLCKSRLSERPALLMALLFALRVAMGRRHNQICAGRTMRPHFETFTVTIMPAIRPGRG